MSTGPIPAERVMRHTPARAGRPTDDATVRAAFPLIRALILATIVTLLIMVGLPQLLAAAAAADLEAAPPLLRELRRGIRVATYPWPDATAPETDPRCRAARHGAGQPRRCDRRPDHSTRRAADSSLTDADHGVTGRPLARRPRFRRRGHGSAGLLLSRPARPAPHVSAPVSPGADACPALRGSRFLTMRRPAAPAAGFAARS